MTPRPTSAQIEAEIAALDECKKYIPRTTKFGESNFDVIDAGVSALADRLSVDDAYDIAGEGEPSREDEARIEAAQWLAGDITETPSSQWASYKK